MLPGGTPTLATPSPNVDGDPLPEKPRRKQGSPRTSEDSLNGAVGDGIGRHSSLTASTGGARVKKIADFVGAGFH